MKNRAGAAAGALFACAAIVAAVVLLRDGRGITFMGDEWSYINRFVTVHGLDSVLRSPGSDYLLVAPLFLYERLLDVFGMTSYVPFRVVAVCVHLPCPLLLFLPLRRRAGARPAAAA